MATVVANYDGPIYLAVAKSMYSESGLGSFGFSLPREYYAAHFPLFPILIRLLSYPMGYPYAMLFVTVLSSILAIYFFYRLAREYLDENKALWLTLVFAIFPARFLIVRSVGSPDPLFVAAVIASLIYFRKGKYLLAGIWGAVAQLTKSPGILLFLAYVCTIIASRFNKIMLKKPVEWLSSLDFKKYLPILLIPLSLMAVFTFYAFVFKDFFAYFHSGDNIHLFFPPFQIFNYSAPWVGTFWLEEVIFVYFFAVLGLLRLISFKEKVLSWFVGIFLISLICVSHRDIIRYALPIVPFIILSFSEVIIKKEFKIAMAALAIPILLFSLAYISQNVMPISNWAPFL
jgi:Gpi18-like mannosyltransferase